METKAYTTLDRKGWPSGPWDDEPDKVQWPDELTGLPCLAVRHEDSGHWCGYVGVPPGHPLHGKCYDDPDVGVHGGLTFADKCHPHETEETGVCHVPGPGEPDHVWWFGFDCAHYLDYSPQDVKFHEELGFLDPRSTGTYRDLDFVQTECAALAEQLYGAPLPV